MNRYTDPQWSRSALITIDTQCDTLDGQSFEIAGTSAILPRVKALLKAYRDRERPIVHIVRIYKADGTNEASERDFRLVLVEDAVSGLNDSGKREMGDIGSAVLSAKQVIEAVRHAGQINK